MCSEASGPGSTSSGYTQPCLKSRHLEQIELAVDLLGFGCPLLSRHHSQRCQLVQLTPRSASGDILCCKGHTDLHHLLRYGDLGKIQMLRMMLAAGADPFCRDATGRTPLDLLLQRYLDPGYMAGGTCCALQQLLDKAIFGTAVEVKVNRHGMLSISLNRPLGLGRHWKRMYCALVACRHKPGAAATELQMLLLHEANLCSVERLSVTPCTVASQTKAASAASADKMHISLEVELDDMIRTVHTQMLPDSKMRVQLRATSGSVQASTRLQQLIALAQLRPDVATQWAVEQGLSQHGSACSPLDFHVVGHCPGLEKSSAMDRHNPSRLHTSRLTRQSSMLRKFHLPEVLSLPASSATANIQKLERCSVASQLGTAS